MRHYSTSLQTSSNSRGSTWREAQKKKLTFPTHNVVPSLLLQRSSSWSQTTPAWALLDSTIPGCTTTCKLAPPTLSPGRLLAAYFVKNSLSLSLLSSTVKNRWGLEGMKKIRDEGIKLKDGNREGRRGRESGRGSTARGGTRKPIGGRKSGYEVKRQEQVKKWKNKTGGEREQVEMKCENMREEKKKGSGGLERNVVAQKMQWKQTKSRNKEQTHN